MRSLTQPSVMMQRSETVEAALGHSRGAT
jgi:hypothetical protein